MPGDFVLVASPNAEGGAGRMVQVPEGHCWIVGDNLVWSRDSRIFGPVPLALVTGKVLAKVTFKGLVPKGEWLQHGLQEAQDVEWDVD